MLDIPYVASPYNACALACYTMTAKYFFPNTTFIQIASISNWQENYIVWGFKFWLWIMNKGIRVTDYDLIDIQAWVSEGEEGLKSSLSENEFNYIKNNSKDLNDLTEDLIKVTNHKNFLYHKQKPTMELLHKHLSEGSCCEVVLDSHTLDNVPGFSLHRVVVLEIKDDIVTFHDPRQTPRPHRKEAFEHFEKSWLTAVKEPELCVYSK